MSEAFAAARQPALDGADRPAELLRRVLAGAALQVAEDERGTVAVLETAELLVDHTPRIVHGLGLAVAHGSPWILGRSPLVPSPPGRRGPDRGGGPEGDTVEPAPARRRVANGTRFSKQDKEGRLERVLHVVGIAQDLPADAQDHRAVALHQDRECQPGPFAVARRDAVEELPVRQVGDDPQVEEVPHIVQDAILSESCHGFTPGSISRSRAPSALVLVPVAYREAPAVPEKI